MYSVLVGICLTLVQNLGTPPVASPDTSDVYAAFAVPVNDAPGSDVSAAAGKLQMGIRARKLGLNSHSAVDAWTQAQGLMAVPSPVPSSTPAVFSGNTASALNTFLATSPGPYVKIAAATLNVDQPIVPPFDGVTLDFGSTQLSAPASAPYMIRIAGGANITILGGWFSQGNTAILVSRSTGVLIDGARMTGLTGDGIVVAGSQKVTISHNRISGIGMAGVLMSGAASQCAILMNDITNNVGQSNWNAGIVSTDRDVDLTQSAQALFIPGNYWPIYEPIQQRLNPPHDNLIAFNRIATNESSGIYLDGGVRYVVFANTIQGNAKEGMCLDNGSTANVVVSNTIQQNGKRWGQTDATLSNDFVLARLPDGTAAAKLPGMSLDNAIYNVVYGNNISHNFGDGVKTVRTSFFNIIGLNTIENNNDGQSIYFQFFGVQLGAAPPDASSQEIDFGPSRGNVIFSNLIRGTHAASIYIQLDSDDNEIFDNVMKDATQWAIESVLTMQNSSRNNLTDIGSQNIGNGCCTMPDSHFPLRGAPTAP